jgi:hypothetical protein
MLRTIRATQYVTALREGGSLPAIIEANDLGLYVLKFRGAGQGPLALVAELVAGEIGRALGLNIPELVFAEVDPALGRNEPDQEIRDLLRASVGLNLALDYLPGSTMFDPAAGDQADSRTASLAVWFDAFVLNVDRTARNANLLNWHHKPYFIDHGAALYFHHNWPDAPRLMHSPFPDIRHHILLPWATALEAAAEHARASITPTILTDILNQVPDDWLLTRSNHPFAHTAPAMREAYVNHLTQRLEASAIFTQEAIRARAQLI